MGVCENVETRKEDLSLLANWEGLCLLGIKIKKVVTSRIME